MNTPSILVKFHSPDGSGCQFVHSAAVSMALFSNSTGLLASIYNVEDPYVYLKGVVSSRLCFDPKPTHVEVCNVPCANDCVTSEWSEWSVCSKTCGVGRVVGYRTRFRDVLARNGSGESLIIEFFVK